MPAAAQPAQFRIYSTLTRTKEPFEPVQPGKVGIYLCGPTVYKPSHIGHMVGPVIFDAIKRYLVYSGYDVTWVVNITDVDDKLINESRDRGMVGLPLAQRGLLGEFGDPPAPAAFDESRRQRTERRAAENRAHELRMQYFRFERASARRLHRQHASPDFLRNAYRQQSRTALLHERVAAGRDEAPGPPRAPNGSRRLCTPDALRARLRRQHAGHG